MCFSVPSHRDYSDTLEKSRNLQEVSAEMILIRIENEGIRGFIKEELYTRVVVYESLTSALNFRIVTKTLDDKTEYF